MTSQPQNRGDKDFVKNLGIKKRDDGSERVGWVKNCVTSLTDNP